MNLREQFIRYCSTERSVAAIRSASTGRDLSLSKDALLKLATAAAGQLRSRGVEKGSSVLLALQTTPDFAPWFWGTQLLGAVCVPIEPFVSERRKLAQLSYLRKLVSLTSARAIVTTSGSTLSPMDVPGVAMFDAVGGLSDARQLGAVLDVDISPDDVALIQFSSGSTGQPKGCVLRQRAVCANACAWVPAFNYQPGESTLNWMPLFHDFGLMVGVIAPVFGGLTSLLMQTEAFVSSPATWLRRLGGVGPVHTAGPSSALALVQARLTLRGAQVFQLENVRSLICAAEPIYPRIVREFFRLTEPFGFSRDVFFAGYGMSETTVFASAKRALNVDTIVDVGPEIGAEATPGLSGNQSIECVSVGRALAGGEFRVVDDAQRILGERRMGHLQLRSPCLMDHYLHSPVQTAEVLHAGWYSTGDIGYLVNGEFHFVTRSKDLICVAGRKFSPADIDLAVSERLGVPPSRVASYGDVSQLATEAIHIAIETRNSDEAELKTLARMACYERTGILPAAVITCPVGTIPKTTSGKVRRTTLRDLMKSRLLTDTQGQQASSAI